jgi:hypothetical protein
MKILGDFFHTQDLSEIEQHFIGVRYQKKVLDDVIQEINVPSVIVGATADDLLSLIW